MMVYRMYCIKDVKGEFWSPKPQANDAAAKRDLHYMVNTPSTLTNQFPSDFELFFVGEFDAMTGVFKPAKFPQFICRADELVGA